MKSNLINKNLSCYLALTDYDESIVYEKVISKPFEISSFEQNLKTSEQSSNIHLKSVEKFYIYNNQSLENKSKSATNFKSKLFLLGLINLFNFYFLLFI